jgi:hypothetical protein
MTRNNPMSRSNPMPDKKPLGPPREDPHSKTLHPARRPEADRHDTYAARRKSSDAFVCDDCGVVGHGGRWFWGAPPTAVVRGGRCPACRRIHDRYPAGRLRLPDLPTAERDALESLLRNVEAVERVEHPLERIIEIIDGPDGPEVTTTGVHVARALANAVERQTHRVARFEYGPAENHLEVRFAD